jgi:hypothetical protein
MDTPEGKLVGRAGGAHVIVPGGPPMHLTATGKETRRALVLILHDSSNPRRLPHTIGRRRAYAKTRSVKRGGRRPNNGMHTTADTVVLKFL